MKNIAIKNNIEKSITILEQSLKLFDNQVPEKDIPSHIELLETIEHHKDMIHFIEQSSPADALSNFSKEIAAYKLAIFAIQYLIKEYYS